MQIYERYNNIYVTLINIFQPLNGNDKKNITRLFLNIWEVKNENHPAATFSFTNVVGCMAWISKRMLLEPQTRQESRSLLHIFRFKLHFINSHRGAYFLMTDNWEKTCNNSFSPAGTSETNVLFWPNNCFISLFFLKIPKIRRGGGGGLLTSCIHFPKLTYELSNEITVN